MTGHLPGVVLEPTRQVQLTCPRLFASWGTRPRARDGPDLYSTTIVQAAPGTVLAVSVASVNGATGVVRLTSSTETSIAPAAEKQRRMTAVPIAALISFTRDPAAREGLRSPHIAVPFALGLVRRHDNGESASTEPAAAAVGERHYSIT